MKVGKAIWLACFLAMAGGLAAGENPVKLSLEPAAVSMKAGEGTTVRVRLDIADSFHVYAVEPQINAQGTGPAATEIAVKTKDLVSVAGPLKTSQPAKHYDPNFDMDVLTLAGRAWIDVPVKTPATLKPGTYYPILAVSYQACDDETCLMPAEVELGFTLTISAAPATVPNSSSK